MRNILERQNECCRDELADPSISVRTSKNAGHYVLGYIWAERG